MRRFRYFFRETLTALRRNALVTFAAISTMFISLFLLAGSLLVSKQVHLIAGEWASKVEVSVFLREDASPDEIRGLGQKIRELREVDRLFFENKQQA
ncbi:MAG TPA: permease-like cell division protein FtsX, partial [Actinomycetota bacterium]|nr:permease-like cell division protein FtsX [Actinomycetota bacterium]